MSLHRTGTRARSIALLLAAASLAPVASRGATLYWDADGDTTAALGGTGTWGTTFWRSGSTTGTLGSWTDGNDVVLQGSAGTLTLGAAVSATSINVSNAAFTITGAYNLTLGAVTVNTGASLTLSNGTTQTLSMSSLTGAGTLTISRGVSATTLSAMNAANALNFTGTLNLGGGASTTAVGMVSGNWLAIGGANITQAASTAFGLNTGTTAADSKDIIFTDVWNSKTLTLSSLSGYGAIRRDSGAAGQVTIKVDQASNTTFNGLVLSHTSGGGAVRSLKLVKAGAGSLTLANIVGKQTASAGAADSNVDIDVNGGTLVLTANNTASGTITVNNGGLLRMENGSAGTNFTGGNASMTSNYVVNTGGEINAFRQGVAAFGTGTITLAGGALYQTSGSWTWTNNITLSSATSSSLGNKSTGSGRSLKIQGVISGSGNLTIADPASAVTSADTGIVLTGTNTMSGTLTIGAFTRVGGVGGNDNTLGAGTAGTLGTATVSINSGKALTFSRSDTVTFSNTLTGAGYIRVGSSGITGTNTQDLTLSGTSDFSGGTELLQGILRVGALANIGTGYLAVKGGSTFVYGGATASTTRNLFLDNGAATINVSDAAATLTWTDASTKGGANGGLITKAGSGTLVLGGAITSGGSTAVTVSGGTLRLNGANTYTGTTTIASGSTLDVASTGTLAATTAVANDGTLAFTGSAGAQALSGLISGSGLVSRSGSGTLTLSNAANSYSGGTSVSNGLLVFSSGALGTTGAVTITGGTLRWATGNTQDISSRLTLANSSTATLDTNGNDVILGNAFGGSTSGSLTKTGNGKLSLAAANTYTGATTVSAGTLALGNASSLGTTDTGTTVASGSTLDLAGQSVGAEALTLSGAGVGSLGALINSSAIAASYAGSITLAASASIGGSGNYTLSGAIGGSSSLAKVGNGRLTLDGVSTYTGATTVSAGTLAIGATGALSPGSAVTVASGASLVLASGGSAGAVTVSSGGSLSGSGSLGAVTLGAGTSSLTAGDGISGALMMASLTFDGSATLNIGTLSNYTSASAFVVTGAVILNGGSGAISLALPTGGVSNGTYNLLSFGSGPANASGFAVSGPTLSERQNAGAVINGSILQYVVSGDNPVWTGLNGSAFAGGGNWKLITAGTATDYILNDSLLFDDSAAGGTVVDISGGNVSPALLTFANSTRNYVIQGDGSIASGNLVKSGAGSLTINNANSFGNVTLGAGTLALGNASALGTAAVTLNSGATLDLGGNSTSASIVLAGGSVTGAGTLAGNLSGSGALTKSGNNTLTLSGTNTYSGGTTVSAGTLVGNAASLQGAIVNNAAVTFNQTADGAYVGVMSGTGSLTKTGNGALTLSGANSYSGGTTISGGALIGDAGSLQGDILNNAAVTFAQLGAGTYAGNISGSGSLTKSGGGALTLSGTNSYSGGTTVSAGTLVGSAASLQGAIANAGTLSFSQSSDGTYAGVISGVGALEKTGNGKLTLSGANTYSGSTTVSAGTLEVSGTLGASGSYAGAIINAGALRLSSASNQTLSGVISGAGTLTKAGNGTLTLSNANTFTGAVTVSAGTLKLGNLAALGAVDKTVGKVTVASGATVDLNGSAASYGYTLSGSGVGGVGALVNNGAAIGTNLAQTSNLKLAADATIGGSAGWALLTNAYGATSLDLGGYTLTKVGAGTFTLANAAVTAGTIRISAGTLATFNTASTAASTALILDDVAGAGLSLSASNLNLAIGALAGGGSSGGNVALGSATLTVGALGTSTSYAGAIAGTGGLTKTGAGTLTLAGANTYTGATAVNAGTLQANSATALGVNSALTVTGTGSVSLGANVTIRSLANSTGDTSASVNLGSSTLTIGTATAGNSGAFYYGRLLGAGTLSLRGGAGTVVGSDGIVTAATGNYQIFTMGTAAVAATSAFALDTGASVSDRKDFAYINDTGDVLTLSSLSGYGAIRNDAGGTSTRQLVVDQSADTTFNGAILSSLNNGYVRQLSLTKRGNGSLTLAGFIGKQTNATGASRVNLAVEGGVLNVTNALNTTTTNSDAINLGLVTVTGGTLSFSAQALLNNAGTAGATGIRLNGGVLRWNAGNTQDLSAGGRLRINDEVDGRLDTNGNDVTLGTALALGTLKTGALTKVGNGTLTLNAVNAYTGLTTVAAGTLKYGVAGAFGSSEVRVVGGTLDLNSIDISNTVILAGGALSNYANWTGALRVGYAVSGSDLDAIVTGYNRNSVTFVSGASVSLSGLTKNAIFEGGSLSNLAGYTADLTVRGALDLSAGTTGGKVILDGGAIQLGGRTAAAGETIRYRSGSLTGAANFGGDLLVDAAAVNLSSGTLGGARVVVGSGNAVTIGTGFSNAIRILSGGTIAADAVTGQSSLGNYSGTVTVASGATLDLDGSANNLSFSNTAANINLESGATLKGIATVGTITVAAGGILAPGNSPGTITATNLILDGGTFNFEVAGVQDSLGGPPIAGQDYDTLVVTGVLDLSNVTVISPFVVNLISIPQLLSNTPGESNYSPLGWDPTKTFELVLASYDSLELGGRSISSLIVLNSNAFYDASGVSVDLVHFSLINDTQLKQLRIAYSPVPEPSTYGLVLGGLALAAAAYRRRRKARGETKDG